MGLFDKEKDLILKLTNLVLLVWLISAITFFHISLVDIIWPTPSMEYSEYEGIYCNIKEPYNEHDNCLKNYEYYRDAEEKKVVNRKKSLIMSAGNIMIVSAGIILLNKKKN